MKLFQEKYPGISVFNFQEKFTKILFNAREKHSDSDESGKNGNDLIKNKAKPIKTAYHDLLRETRIKSLEEHVKNGDATRQLENYGSICTPLKSTSTPIKSTSTPIKSTCTPQSSTTNKSPSTSPLLPSTKSPPQPPPPSSSPLSSSCPSESKSISISRATEVITEADCAWIKRVCKEGRKYILIAAISGAAAIAIDIYVKREWRMLEYGQIKSTKDFKSPTVEMKETFSNANRVHLMNSAVMMTIPYASRKPALTFGLLASGLIGYCGSNYSMTFKAKNMDQMEFALIGEILLMLSWLSFTL